MLGLERVHQDLLITGRTDPTFPTFWGFVLLLSYFLGFVLLILLSGIFPTFVLLFGFFLLLFLFFGIFPTFGIGFADSFQFLALPLYILLSYFLVFSLTFLVTRYER